MVSHEFRIRFQVSLFVFLARYESISSYRHFRAKQRDNGYL